jgi:hypothetical protein
MENVREHIASAPALDVMFSLVCEVFLMFSKFKSRDRNGNRQEGSDSPNTKASFDQYW